MRIYTRSGQDWTDKFAGVAERCGDLDVRSALLDGEIVALDEKGRSSFAELQHGLKEGKIAAHLLRLRSARAQRPRPAQGAARAAARRSCSELLQTPAARHPLLRPRRRPRREGLRQGLPHGARRHRIQARRQPVPSRRTKSWLKIKCAGNDEFVIGGYRRSDKKGRAFASLLLGEYEGKDLHYRGRVGTGFDEKDLDGAGRAARASSSARRARSSTPAARDRARRPLGRAAACGADRLHGDDAGRAPAPPFVPRPARRQAGKGRAIAAGRRHGKRPKASGRRSSPASSSRAPARFCSQRPEITKEELAEYLLSVADRMLPHVSGRPLSLVRCPDGAGKACFFQKHATKGMPSALKTVPVKESDGKIAKYLMIDSAAGLVAAAQIGGLEMHIWGSHAKTIEHPDRLVFDLDPDSGLTFADVREAARDVRKLLQTARARKLSPRHRRQGHPRRGAARREPGLGRGQGVRQGRCDASSPRTSPSASPPPCRRPSARGASSSTGCATSAASTAIAPYSPRARGNASVATPVSWSELGRIDARERLHHPRRAAPPEAAESRSLEGLLRGPPAHRPRRLALLRVSAKRRLALCASPSSCGRPLRGVSANSSSCRSDIDSYIDFDAPLRLADRDLAALGRERDAPPPPAGPWTVPAWT